MKKALIIGCSGQDGRMLATLLRSKDYRVVGLSRTGANPDCDEHIRADVAVGQPAAELVQRYRPDELYYLAAYNFSSQATELNQIDGTALRTFSVNVDSYLAILDAVRLYAPRCRVFYACSALIFGEPAESPQTECTCPNPCCLYSISKLAGRHLSEFYRANMGIHASVGVLYNHESSLRGDGYLSTRIINGVKALASGASHELVVGDLGAQCDWGYAGDFAEAMWLMLQQERADTCIVATGQLHTVRDWVETAFRIAGLDPAERMREDPSLLSRRRPVLVGDAGKLRRDTGWSPKIAFTEMVRRMYHGEI